MTVEINRVTERELAVSIDISSTYCYGVIELGTYPDRVTIILNPEVLRTLGSRIIDALESRGWAVSGAEETPEETPELTCDTCGQKVIVVDRMYKHYDPEETKADKDASWFRCSHFGGVEYGHACCTVNGHYAVPEDDEDDETPEETSELTCDNCGRKVIVVNGEYKHYDPEDAEDVATPGWYGCSHMAGSAYYDSYCVVNGHYVVPDDELGELTVDAIL